MQTVSRYSITEFKVGRILSRRISSSISSLRISVAIKGALFLFVVSFFEKREAVANPYFLFAYEWHEVTVKMALSC